MRKPRTQSEELAAGKVDEFELRLLTAEEQRRALLALYGVGPASVGYVHADVFHQVDELAHVSPWDQKILSRLFFGTDVDDPVLVPELLALSRRTATAATARRRCITSGRISGGGIERRELLGSTR